jgi:hypothetical protein
LSNQLADFRNRAMTDIGSQIPHPPNSQQPVTSNPIEFNRMLLVIVMFPFDWFPFDWFVVG